MSTIKELKELINDLPDDTPVLLRTEYNDVTDEYVTADFVTLKLKPTTPSGIWWKLDIEGKECLIIG